MIRNLLIITLSITLISCFNGHKTSNLRQDADTVEIRYAKGFAIINHADYRQIDIYSPWTVNKGEIQQRYYLVARHSNTATPPDGIRVETPVKAWATSSCTHVGYLDALNELNNIKGVTNPSIIYNPTIRQGTKRKEITDIGDALNINTEILLRLQPDVLILNLIGANDKQAQHITSTGTTILYNNEWKEGTPLARTEWIKLIAAFCCKDSLADSVFNSVEQRYNAIRAEARNFAEHPEIMSGGNFRGTWYVPGGETYMGHLFRDAAAQYVFNDDKSTESIPLNMEQALLTFSHAGVWVGAPANSIEELIGQEARYNMIDAVHNGRVYNFYRRCKQGGANDFWETGVVRPDLILKDLVKILHTEYMPDDSLNFARRLL